MKVGKYFNSGPVQKQYKKYETDASRVIPRSTTYYRKRKLHFSDSNVSEGNSFINKKRTVTT